MWPKAALVLMMQEVTTVRMSGLSRHMVAVLAACALLAIGGCPAQAATVPSDPTSSTPGGGDATGGEPRRDPLPADPSECDSTAAEELGWGEPDRQSDFQDGLPDDWHPYGPEPGHNKKGTRTPEAISVEDGNATITSTQDGATGAMSWHPGQRYGRWEACVRSDAGKGGINALLLLWPVAEDFPVGGEVDWMEIMSADRQKTSFFLHYGASNNQEYGAVQHDATEWSAYALEWTRQKMTAFVNGKEWYSTTDTSHFPPRPMNMTMQLDYFGGAGGGTAMHMDWSKQWALPESEGAELSLAPGDPATGQPRDYPERAPRELRADEMQVPAGNP